MRILHVTDTYGDGAGGASMVVDSLCRLLEDKGYQNGILYSNEVGELPAIDRQVFYAKGICNFRLRAELAQYKSALTFIEEFQPEVVHFHQVTNYHLISYLSKRYPTVLYLYNHVLSCASGLRLFANTTEVCTLTTGPACLVNHYTKRCGSRRPQNVLKDYLLSSLNQGVARSVTRLVAISSYVKQTLVQAGFAEEQVRVIHSLTPAALQFSPEENVAYPFDAKVILFVGRITEIKGLEFLIKSLPLLKQDWRAILLGDGYRLLQAQKLVQDLGLQERVEFRAWVPNEKMAEIYHQASLVVVPSIYPDPSPLVGVEAMHHGRPVVAFDVGGMREWLEDGYNGFLCRHPDLTDLAAKIDQLLADPQLAARMGANGRQKLKAEFDPADIANQFIECYQEAIHDYAAVR